jgi:hypothetical protein
MARQYYNNVGYSLSQSPLNNLAPFPVVAKRAPTTADTGYAIGTIWIYSATNAPYILTSIVSNSANWQLLESGGGAGVFSSLTVTPGPISLTGTTTINTSGAAVTTIGTGGTGAVNIGNATGNTAVTGSLTASTGLVATTGGITATGTSNINTSGSAVTSINTGGTGALNLGNATGNTAVTGSLTASTSLTATLGNITATNGNVILSTAATYVQLPGPIKIMSGAGAPAVGLAAEVGDMYINTTAASAVTRIYVATAAGTWTNVTCAA